MTPSLGHARPVFVDTSAWYAVADAGDSQHARAARQFSALVAAQRMLLTTNYVAAETYTLMRIRLGRRPAAEFLRRLRSSRLADRVFVSDTWEAEAEVLLERYADQDFSYIDATSFVTMKHLRLQEAFAFDHHFQVAGFVLAADA